jgi:DNA polymerase-3 subunit gamma/tau
MRGQDTDVIEIDAASNTAVDNARELIANSAYRPAPRQEEGLHHRRGPHALDAGLQRLLKTMEEPPEHVVFILCTTESHKVPATIQSRCQRFDFRNIPTSEIAGHLKAVLKDENAKADEDLIHMVARLGNGSMRDALSLMDRLLASGEKKLTVELLQGLLGLPDRELISGVIDAAADGDPKGALEKADELTKRGISPDQLLEALMERLRDLMVLAACGAETELVELSGPTRQEEVRRAGRFDAAGLVHMIALCESIQRAIKNTATPRALLDALVVRLAMTEKLADVTALASRLASNGAPERPR